MVNYKLDYLEEILFDKLKFRLTECGLITNMLNCQSDFLIYGAPGSGKTFMVRELLKGYKINHVRINCIQANTKTGIMSKLSQQFQKLFKYKIKECSKLRNFIVELKELAEFLKRNKIDDFNFHDNSFYLILDNFDKINVTPKFIKQLIQIKQILNINFSIIFIGVNLPSQEIVDNYALSLVPQFMIPAPTQEFQIDLLKQYMQDRVDLYQERNPYFQKVYNKISNEFLSNIVQLFGKSITDLGQLIHITWQIFQVMCILGEQNVQSISFLLNCRAFKTVKKILLENPMICEGNIDVLIKHVNSVMCKDDKQIQFEKQRGTVIKLPYIPALIVIACWLGNRSLEKYDIKMFKARKQIKKRRVPKSIEEDRQIRPIKLNRLLALVDSLISLYGQELEELENYDRSTDFYHQLAVLEQYQFIQKHIQKSKDELGSVKYICNLEQATVDNLATEYEINIYNHLLKN